MTWRNIVPFECDGDGCTASDLKLFKYTRIKRPLYPFDPEMRLGRNEA